MASKCMNGMKKTNLHLYDMVFSAGDKKQCGQLGVCGTHNNTKNNQNIIAVGVKTKSAMETDN